MSTTDRAQFQTIHIRKDYTIDIPAFGRCIDADELADIARRAGSPFFSADSMRFFGGRVHDVRPMADCWAFITSEKRPRSSDPRGYTLRTLSFYPDGSGVDINTIGTFQQYSSLNRARTALKQLIAGQVTR